MRWIRPSGAQDQPDPGRDDRAPTCEAALHRADRNAERRRNLLDRQVVPVEHFYYLAKRRRRVVHREGHDASLLASREELVRIGQLALASGRPHVARGVKPVFGFARAARTMLHAKLVVRDAEKEILECGAALEMMNGFETCNERHLHEL